jgi:hypothetical protein
MCGLIFLARIVWDISYTKRIERDIIVYVLGLHVKYPLCLSDFNKAWIFLIDFRKNNSIPSLLKIRPVGAELFHADR